MDQETFVTRNQFLTQEIISCERTSFGKTYRFARMPESYQQIRLSLYISWEPGSQVPSEFAALVFYKICLPSFTSCDPNFEQNYEPSFSAVPTWIQFPFM